MTGCNTQGFTFPILEYDNTGDDCAVIGGYRYRGPDPMLRGRYYYGDNCSGAIFEAIETLPGVWSSSLALDHTAGINAFGEDENGVLYFVDRAGALYRVPEPGAASTGIVSLVTLAALAHQRRRPASGRGRA